MLGIETSCDETAAAVVSADGEIRSNVVASQDELHARFGGVVPEVASRRHLELVTPVIQQALDDAGVELGGRRRGRRHGAARADRRAARRRLRREGARLVARPAAGPGRPPARPRRVALPAAARPRAAVHLPARERRAHAAARRRATTARFGVLGTTLDDAAGEAFDKGARLLGLGYPGGPRSTRSRARVIRPPSTSRSRACPGSTSPSRA